jgi:DNA-binding MarR family transcriptional regulator
VDRSTLAELVARLAERGLLERSRSTTDARAKQVRLTEAGRERLDASRPAAAEVDQALLARLPKDKRARFLKDLGRLIAGPPETAAVDPAAKSGGKKKKKSKKSGA